MEETNSQGNKNASLARELLEELKRQTKRWMVAFFAVLILWGVTVAGFLWYMSLYDYSSYTQDGGGYNNINTGEGDIYNNGTEIPSAAPEGR